MSNDYRTINLEDDLPTVEQAMHRLALEIQLAKRQNIRLMKIIHGFGSSGRGGKIRPATRAHLETLQKKKQITCYICGEKLSIFDSNTRLVIDKCPNFRRDSDLERHNNGITVVLF